jgi:hypothetical protein
VAPACKLTPSQREFLAANIPQFDCRRWEVSAAASAGSDRRFVRVRRRTSPGQSYIMIVWDSSDHDWSRYLSISQEVSRTHSLLPSIFIAEPAHGLILEEDLGSVTLKAHVEQCGGRKAAEAMYRRVLDTLLIWHGHTAGPGSPLAQRTMDRDMFLWESGYFAVHCATEYFGQERLLGRDWERQRRKLADRASALPHVCMHRDFQSENVMIDGGRVRFVDFQGARLGPAEYDLAALLFDPYVALLDKAMAQRLFEYYASRSSRPVDAGDFRVAAVQRLLQACGAFCNLSLHKGKDRYRAFIPVGLKRLRGVLEACGDFPAVRRVVSACIQAGEQASRA